MSTRKAILDLISDDFYLLWEVKGLADLRNPKAVQAIKDEVLALARDGLIRVHACPIVGNSPARALTADEALQALGESRNWDNPSSDSAEAIWVNHPL